MLGLSPLRHESVYLPTYPPTYLPIYLQDAPLVCVDQVLEHKRRDPSAERVVVQDRLEHHTAALAQRLRRRVGPWQCRRAVAVGSELEEPRRRCDSLTEEKDRVRVQALTLLNANPNGNRNRNLALTLTL